MLALISISKHYEPKYARLDFWATNVMIKGKKTGYLTTTTKFPEESGHEFEKVGTCSRECVLCKKTTWVWVNWATEVTENSVWKMWHQHNHSRVRVVAAEVLDQNSLFSVKWPDPSSTISHYEESRHRQKSRTGK